MCHKWLLLLITSVWASNLNAQTDSSPCWIKKTPTPKSGNFYYRVTYTEGTNYKDMYAESFAMAIYESYSKWLGIPVSINSTEETIKENVLQSIKTEEDSMRLPINKVCEYLQFKYGSKYGLYVLWQVPKNPSYDPQFEDYNCYDCN